MSKGPSHKPVVIERRPGKLFQASRPLRLRFVVLLILGALILGGVLALGLKRVLVIDTEDAPEPSSYLTAPGVVITVPTGAAATRIVTRESDV